MAMKNPPHPGQHVKAAIDELNLTTAKAAQALGVTRANLHNIVSGKSSISPEMALRLEFVIGSTVRAWLRLQTAYDEAQVRLRADEITKGLQRLPTPTTSKF